MKEQIELTLAIENLLGKFSIPNPDKFCFLRNSTDTTNFPRSLASTSSERHWAKNICHLREEIFFIVSTMQCNMCFELPSHRNPAV